jgi:NADH-quinone oxidoreductase subunit E
MPISDATRDEAQLLVQRYPVARSALLPLLHLVQGDEGYVSEDGIAFCAEVLGLTKAEVGAVATFYTMYKREPFGDYLLSVCTNPTCKIAGAQDIYESYVQACGGHIDRDGAGVMVEHAECLGICDAAPVVQINYEMYGPVTNDEAMDLLAKAKAGDPPASNRSGEVPPTFREVEREFSGILDGTDAYLIEAARLQAAATVPPSYRSGETDIPVTHPGGDPAGHGGTAFRAAAGFDVGATRAATLGDGEDPVTEEVVEEVADTHTGVSGELAEHVAGRTAATPPPSTAAQPDLEPGAETPTEATEAGEVPASGAAGHVDHGAPADAAGEAEGAPPPTREPRDDASPDPDDEEADR